LNGIADHQPDPAQAPGDQALWELQSGPNFHTPSGSLPTTQFASGTQPVRNEAVTHVSCMPPILASSSSIAAAFPLPWGTGTVSQGRDLYWTRTRRYSRERQTGRHSSCPRYTRRHTCCSERRGSGCQSARTHQSLQNENMEDHDIILSYQAKGIGGLAARAGTILTRFGVTPGRMEAYLTHYADLAHEFGTRLTLPITGCVLARHP